MSKKETRYIVVLLAVTILFSAFSISAFAVTGSTSSSTSSAASTTSKVVSSQASTISQTGGSSKVGRETDSNQVLVTFNLAGGTGLHSSASVTKGTTVSEFKIPTRKGYTFAGWAINGSEVPGSLQITEPKTLTAEWTKAASASSSKPDSVDTNEQQVEAAASEADQATSDPGTLSSQDWNAVLNTSSNASSTVSSAVSSQVSSAAQAGGGFSTLFLVGVILVVLGVAGVGAFIYLQFIRGKGGKGGPHGPDSPDKATDDTIVFTDISSYSDGKKHNSELYGAVRQPVPNGQTKKAAENHPQRPAHSTAPVRRQAEEPTQYLERSEAKAVPSNKSDFDWEKFFNEESRND